MSKSKPQNIGKYATITCPVVSEVRLDQARKNDPSTKRQARRTTGLIVAYFCAHEFEKDANASSAIKVDKATKGVSEWPDEMRSFWPISRSLSKRTSSEFSVITSASTLHMYRHRLFAAHDERGDAEGVIHGTPAVSRKIKNKKNIAGKQRCQNVAQFVCVPNRARHSRSETAEPKSIEVELRAVFAIGMHARRKPTFPAPQTQSLGRECALCARVLFNCNTVQHQLLLNDAQNPQGVL